MKSTSIRTKIGLLATVACVALATPAHAVVTWVVSEDGTGVTMVTEGTLTLATSLTLPTTSIGANYTGHINYMRTVLLVVRDGDYQYTRDPLGSQVGEVPLSSSGVFIQNPSSTSTGSGSFGHIESHLYFDVDSISPTSPFTLIPSASTTFPGETISSLFGSRLDSGPVTLWSATTTNDTIQIALAVPEPSSTALLGLGGLALMLRRRN